MNDRNNEFPVLREWREAGKTRYIGVTTTELERLLRTQRMDFMYIVSHPAVTVAIPGTARME